MTRPDSRTLARSAPVALLLAVLGLVLTLSGCGGSSAKAAVKPTPPTTAPVAPKLPTGSDPAPPAYVTTSVPITFDGLARSYLVATPPTLAAPGTTRPVVVVLHGRSVTPDFEEQRTALPQVAQEAILVYPAGIDESWDAGNCCVQAEDQHIDDIGFVKAVIAQVKATHPAAAPGKAFLLGYSNGGKLALDLACVDSGDFQGVAVFGATDSASCPNRAPANVLMMAGTADNQIPASNAPVAPEADGFQPPSFDQEVSDFRTADGCTRETTRATAGALTLTSWLHCKGVARTGQAIFQGQNHDWPAGGGGTPSGGAVAWSWFQALGA